MAKVFSRGTLQTEVHENSVVSIVLFFIKHKRITASFRCQSH